MTTGPRPAIGVASPPRYLDRTPERLRDFFDGRVETLQTIVRIPGLAYDRPHFLAGWRACEEAFDDLAGAGAQV